MVRCGVLGRAAAQCQALMDTHHVYLLLNGRISMAGLNSRNLDYVADAIHAVVTGAPARAP
jgi:aspartate aminotransferase, cytoplasmic